MSGDKYRAALDAAAKQLSYRALSAKMLRDKLLGKGHDEEAADYALAWLTERRLLDDVAYAESVVRGYTRKGYGAMRIRQELGRRGVDRETTKRRSTRRSRRCSGAGSHGAISARRWPNTGAACPRNGSKPQRQQRGGPAACPFFAPRAERSCTAAQIPL